jgi:hypothetical protein
MNALSPTLTVAETHATAVLNEEGMRQRLFDQFNAFWLNGMQEGVAYDTIATMTMTASIYGVVAKHGEGTAIEFLEGLVASLRSGEFAIAHGGRSMGA